MNTWVICHVPQIKLNKVMNKLDLEKLIQRFVLKGESFFFSFTRRK